MERIDKPENNKVIFQLNQKHETSSEIDLINVFEYMGKKKKLVAYLLILAILIGISGGILYSGFEHISGKGSYARAMITFQFDGIEKGLDPNGAAFDVSLLKSPYVIESALSGMGIDERNIETVRKNINIVGVIPEDAVERITVINKMAEKDTDNYEKLLDVSYFPSQYVVYLYDDGTFKNNELSQILNGVLSSYKQYFLDTYANAEALTVTSNLLSGDDYDYGESIDLVKTQISIMLSYVEEKMKEAPDFRASSTGLSFEDIVTALNFVKSVDVSRLSSFVESNSLTKDKSRQVEYYEYRIRTASNEISELETQLETVSNIISSYEKDPVVVVSGSDSTLQYGEKNEYYDQLVSKKISLNQQIAEKNTGLNEYYLLLNNLNAVAQSNVQADYEYADSLLARLNTTIANWVALVEETTEEYYTTTLFSNAVKVAVPAQYFVDGGIMHIAKNVAIPSAILVLIVLIWWFFNGVKAEIVNMRIKEERNNKRKGSEQIIL
ncbi:hypothetical protein [Butyrivibrio sp. YAB3001]|uniref:hypothetical protein n=1 Tax=Butyrivibrio sp. YAB3001 TaxID=1520812 RepID=UPI0008F65576|nr:hypothetical protein [Butyrivibrio sp. YAB3001]SFC10883.1 hypothetical protein SAMN02910398_01520 [Butyrivibrio sp. YAB3001]